MRQAINDKDHNTATEEETTKKQKCKEKKKGWNWCHEHIVKSISFWIDEECLYKTTAAGYKDKNKRLNALKRGFN